jgi:hypothetical protein
VEQVIIAILALLVLGMLLIFLAIFALFLYMIAPAWKLNTYLMDHYTKRWEELTTIGSWGPGIYGTKSSRNYIYDDRDTDDPFIMKSKLLLRQACSLYRKLFISLFCGLALSFIAAALLSMFRSSK